MAAFKTGIVAIMWDEPMFEVVVKRNSWLQTYNLVKNLDQVDPVVNGGRCKSSQSGLLHRTSIKIYSYICREGYCAKVAQTVKGVS